MKKILFLGGYLGLVAAFFAVLLAVTNEVTTPRIAQIQADNFQRALLEGFPQATSYNIIDDVSGVPSTMQIIEVFHDDELIGFVYSQTVKGFVDNISYLVGINTEGYFTSFGVLSSRETPGFGTRIETPEWKNRVIDVHGSSEIDVIVSATLTTAPIIDAMSHAYEDFTRRIGGN